MNSAAAVHQRQVRGLLELHGKDVPVIRVAGKAPGAGTSGACSAYSVGPAEFAFIQVASATRPVAGAHELHSMKTVAFKRRPARGHISDAKLV